MKITEATLGRWKRLAADFLNAHNYSLEDVKLGADAWAVASRSGITQEGYKLSGVNDAHIQTALERIFPNVTFKDAKRY